MHRQETHLRPTMRNSRGNYTLDELLQVKRAEKPAPCFWNKFENNLRIKQRRLLQLQPVEDLGAGVSGWPRFRNFGLLCGAVTFCGVFSFLAIQLLSPAYDANSFRKRLSYQEIIVSETKNPANLIESETDEPVLFEVAFTEGAISNIPENTDNPKQTTSLANAKSIPRSPFDDAYVLEIETPFQSINVDDTIAFNADENITSRILERYIHPLSDRGWKFTQFVSNQSDPLNRVSTIAPDSSLFKSNSGSDVRWNALTLRF